MAGLEWKANGNEAVSGMGESAWMEVDGSETEATVPKDQGKKGTGKATSVRILCGLWVLRKPAAEGFTADLQKNA